MSAVSGPSGWHWQTNDIIPAPMDSGFDLLGDIDGDGLMEGRQIVAATYAKDCPAFIGFSDRTPDGHVVPDTTRWECGNRPDLKPIVGPNAPPPTRRSFLADVNGDQIADLIIVYPGIGYEKFHYVSYFLGDGTGQFQTENHLLAYIANDYYNLDDISRLHMADVNDDGRADIVLEVPAVSDIPAGVAVYLSFPSSYPLQGASADQLAPPIWVALPPGVAGARPLFGDMNGNGTLDYVLVAANAVHYIDFRPGSPGGLLTDIDNGLGSRTHITYESTSVLDATARTPWKTHTPKATYVVTSVTSSVPDVEAVSANANYGIGSVAGSANADRVTSYEYRDPAWDGWRHVLRGFSEIVVTHVGDGSEPTSTVDTRYWQNPCHQLPVVEPRSIRCMWTDNDADDVQSGWPIITEVASATQKLSTTKWTYTSPNDAAIAGMDGRVARFSYASQIDTWLYDTASSGTDTQSVIMTVAGDNGDSRPDAVKTTVVLGSKQGREHVRTRQQIDGTNGNVHIAYDDGRVTDDGNPVDDPIVTTTEWTQVSPDTRWRWRPKTVVTSAFADRPGPPHGHPRSTALGYDLLGQLRTVTGALLGSVALHRQHEDPTRATAPAPQSASGIPSRIDSSYGTLVKSMTADPDGFVRETVFGDMANGDAAETTATRTPNGRRQLQEYKLHQAGGPGDIHVSGFEGNTTLAAWSFRYDDAEKVMSITDERRPSDWPVGAKPVSRTMTYDDFSRVTNVTYDSGGDAHVAPLSSDLNLRAVPSVGSKTRVRAQTFEYDWLGNTKFSGDDASAFFDRSLGTIQNGGGVFGPNQLASAYGTQVGGTPAGELDVRYDPAGN